MRYTVLVLLVLSFSIARAQKPDSVMQVQWEAANQALKQGDFSGATSQFTKLIDNGFPNKEDYAKRGLAYYNLKEYNKAKADLDEDVKSRIQTAELYESRGNTRYYLDDFQGAASDLEKAVGMGASTPSTLGNLGNAKFRLENYREAITWYDKAIAGGESSNAILFNNRGKAKTMMKEYKLALPDFDKALELKPNYDKATENRADARFLTGDWKGSISDYEKLIASGRNDV